MHPQRRQILILVQQRHQLLMHRHQERIILQLPLEECLASEQDPLHRDRELHVPEGKDDGECKFNFLFLFFFFSVKPGFYSIFSWILCSNMLKRMLYEDFFIYLSQKVVNGAIKFYSNQLPSSFGAFYAFFEVLILTLLIICSLNMFENE